jgi:hypothetical protein
VQIARHAGAVAGPRPGLPAPLTTAQRPANQRTETPDEHPESHAVSGRQWSGHGTRHGRTENAVARHGDLVVIHLRHRDWQDGQPRLDPVLARFLSRSRFAWLAEGTRAYAKDYRLFSSG